MGMPKTADRRGYAGSKDELQQRLRRIEGQVRGVQRMIDEDRWCPDILIQVAAIQAALDKVALGLAEDHARHCVMGAAAGEREERTAGADGRHGPADPARLAVTAGCRGCKKHPGVYERLRDWLAEPPSRAADAA